VIADGQPSFTAFTAAAARAAHLIVDDAPVIFADTLAEAMLGERAEELIAFHRLHGTHPILAGARAQATCRSRYAEDRLADAADRGIGQYVLLGAGLDTFAWRSPLAAGIRVFEVDHPATQEWKRRAGRDLSRGRGVEPDQAEPEHTTFVPVEFGRDSLGDALGRAGFDFAAPAFVSWLGVTMYLERDAIGQTLAVAGGLAPGSEIVLDYMLSAGLRDAAGDLYAAQIGPASAERGEPWLSLLGPDEVTALLAGHGFGAVRHVRQRDMAPAAVWDRTDALRPAELSRIAHARVGPFG
jgi:methyltransferase (TIGR00027 family)